MRRDPRSTQIARVDADRVVRETWEALLGFEPVEPDDRFGDLGGTSLLAEQMLVRLRADLDVAISPADLAGDPTVAELAARIARPRSGPAARPTPTSTSLRDVGHDSPAVFCVSGAGATTAAFLPLADALPPTITVHAFQSAGLESRSVPDWSVARAARRRLRSLRAVRAHGPYLLIGHSFGGHIAAEMARTLIAEGEQLAGLHLLDTVALGEPGASVADLVVTPGARPSLRQRWATHLRVYSAGLRHLEPRAHRAAIWEQAVRAQNRYRVSALPPRSTVYVTDQNAPQRDRWRRLSPGTTVIDVPGDHNGILSDHSTLADVVARIVHELSFAADSAAAIR